MQSYVEQQGDLCAAGEGDGQGTLAFPISFNDVGAHGSTIEFVAGGSGALLQKASGDGMLKPAVFPLLTGGFLGVAGPGGYLGPRDYVQLWRWDHTGSASPGSFWASLFVAAGVPAGALLLAGDFTATGGGSALHGAALFDQIGAKTAPRWGPVPLASSGTVVGAGVDVNGRALVLTLTGSSGGGSAISGQWFAPDGKAMTAAFTVVDPFPVGVSTWLETSRLIGGGLLVRRMDQTYPPAASLHSTALVVVASGAANVQPAPGWMTSRPDQHLEFARGGHAYAALPFRAYGVACTQRVEVLAPDGTSCGSRDYPVAAGICDTGEMTLGLDGTVIQQLPRALEKQLPPDAQTARNSCTWRWWPGAVR